MTTVTTPSIARARALHPHQPAGHRAAAVAGVYVPAIERLPRAICRHDTAEYQVGWTRGHSADERDGARATG